MNSSCETRRLRGSDSRQAIAAVRVGNLWLPDDGSACAVRPCGTNRASDPWIVSVMAAPNTDFRNKAA